MKLITAGFLELGDTLQITVAEKPIIFVIEIQKELSVKQFLVTTKESKSFESTSSVEVAKDKYQMLKLICKQNRFRDFVSLNYFEEIVNDTPFNRSTNNYDYERVIGRLEKDAYTFVQESLA